MVDAVVSFVVERIGDYLTEEAAFLQGVRGEVESLKKDLEWMLCFIKDAEEKQVDNPLIRQWVSDIREIAYGCEDVLDNFMVKVHDRKFSNVLKVEEGETLERRQGVFTSIKKCSCKFASHMESNLYIKCKKNASLYRIGKEIKALKKRLKEVSDRCVMYGLEDINKRWEASKALREFKEVRRTTSFAFEENVIGYKDDFRMLLGQLLCNAPQHSIISIWGTGGLGKTTLAKKLYHHDKVKNKFQHRAWVCVSQDFNVEDLLRRIINSFNFNHTKKLKKMEVEEALKRNLNEFLELEKMKEEALKRYIHESLRESSYLVVLDDVWGKNAWGRLIEAFPKNEHGSRIIITSRNKNIADCADYVHHLPFLTEEESWRLFCSKTYGKANETKEMEKLGKEMLQKCGGLPLAIVLLGGLLSKKNAQEWRLVHGHMWQHLNRDSDNHINYLLSLSFNDLPYQMRLCFLYMSQFPEDFEIPVMKVIHLLVAEGFIPHNREIMEDTAYYYVNELFRRSLIQKDKTQRGRILTCHIHDLLRNFAIEKAEELNLFHILDVHGESNSSSKTRRQAVYFGTGNNLQHHKSNLMRSLFFFNIEHRAREDLPRLCCRFRLLRVLNLSNSAVKTIPQEIGKLILLKYLQLGLSFNRDVPQWILNLVSLQTLNILGNDSYPRLPTEIFKLQELRHLIGNFIGYFCIDKLKNLQTLKRIPVETWIKTNPERLVNLRELHITGFGQEVSRFTLDSIAKLKSLRILRVYASRREIHSLTPLSECQNLVELTLSARIEKVPEEMPEILPNLEFLELYVSGVVDDPMPTLEKLPNLAVLNLGVDCFNGTKLVCSKGGFPRLEILAIHGSRLEELQVAEGAMPELRSFIKSYSTIDFRIPERLETLPPPSNWEYESSDLEQY